MVNHEWSGDGNGDGDDEYGSWCDVCRDMCCVRSVVVALPFLQRGTCLGVCRPFL